MIKKQVKSKTYFYRSVPAIVILNSISGGLYSLYWFYKHWDSISNNTGKNKHAVWAAIFSLFTIYNLAGHIANLDNKKPANDRVVGYAVVYIILSLSVAVGGTLAGINLITLLAFFVINIAISAIVAGMQSVVNKYILNNKIKTVKKLRPAETIFVAIGIIFVVVDIVLYSTPNYGIPVLNSTDAATAQILLKKSEDLNKKYILCSDDLSKTLESLDDTDTVSVDKYYKAFDDCESVRIEQNKAADEYNKMTLGVYSIFSN